MSWSKADATSPPHLYAALERYLTRMALARGDASEAVALARRGLARLDASSRPANEMMPALIVLAEAQNSHGEFVAARATAQRALKMATERLGELEHSYNAGQAHGELGVALAGLGDLQSGRSELEQALTHLRSSVGPDAPYTRRALAQLQRLGS